MEVALRRRLEGVEHVAISQSQQTTTVTFVPGARTFSAAVFRSALQEADVEVVTLDIDVCGTIEEQSGERWLTGAGPNVLLRGDPPEIGEACVTGRLNDQMEPQELDVRKVTSTRLAVR